MNFKVLAAVLLCGPAFAQDGDMAGLTARVESYEAMMVQGKLAEALDYLPPSLLEQVAQQAGTDPAGFREMMAKQIEGVAAGADFSSAKFDIPLEAVTIEHTDTGRAYALATSTSVFPAFGVPETTTPMVAMVEGDEWYFVRIESPMHAAMLEKVYPDMAGPLAAAK